MKPSCKTCAYFSEGNDGEYGGGSYYCECSHPMWEISDYCIGDYLYFPFMSPPGCYIPNAFMAPKKFEPAMEINENNFYDFMGLVSASLSEWSGDIIELIEI